MSVFGAGLSWLVDGANWEGEQGIPTLAEGQLRVTGEALLVAIAIGVPVGSVLGHIRKGGGLITAIGSLGRAVPTIGLLLLFASFATFGIRERTAVIALALFALPPILTNTFVAVSTIDNDTLEAARGMGMRTRQVLGRVELPLSIPLLAAGVRTTAVQTFATATLATYVSLPTLGYPIQVGFAGGLNELSLGQVTGAAIVVAVLALLLDVLLSRVQAVLTPGPISVWRRVLPGGGATLPRAQMLPNREVPTPAPG